MFARLSDAQRVGQLFAVGLQDDRLSSSEAGQIRRLHFGSVTFIETTSVGASAIRDVSHAVQALATDKATGSVRFFVAANQEGGLIQALRGPGFSRIPSAVVQGRMAVSDLRARASEWGRQLLAAGVNLDFAPVMDVVPPGADEENEPIGVLQRGYGHDPNTVAKHGVAFLRGMERAGVATTAKHFPGLGRVKGNTDFTAEVVDRTTTADDPYMDAFRDAIEAGVPFVMVALATYTRIDPDHLAVFSQIIMEQLLRDKLQFTGVVVSDDLGEATAVAAIPPAQRAIDFLVAGGDMVVSKTVGPAEAMSRAILSRVRTDASFRARVRDAVLRILRAKGLSGLLPCG
ncbi:MAG TPA: glycoside hydrolase family 3 N-terminal domain-containing protein [Actinomycetota bacterium]|nr:glycoside hydrolase family 3 N-terminal domain-containing protein [Actinomycetota bacterium]